MDTQQVQNMHDAQSGVRREDIPVKRVSARESNEHRKQPSDKQEDIKNRQVETEDVEKGVNDFLKMNKTELQVEIDKESNTPVYKIVRSDDDQVIMEIPPREMREIASKIKNMVGVLFDSNA